MSNFPSSPSEDRETTPHVISSSSKTSFWLGELPYAVVFALAIFGIAYNSYSKQSIVGYWQFLALVICLVCIGSGWPHAHDKKARLRLVWTQALHWLAFLVAMNVVLLPGVQRMMNADATSLAILTLLALGTFTAGVHILAWQICLVGVVMAAGGSCERLAGAVGPVIKHWRAGCSRDWPSILALHTSSRSSRGGQSLV